MILKCKMCGGDLIPIKGRSTVAYDKNAFHRNG